MSAPDGFAPARLPKTAAAFRTIGEAADELNLPAHVLRFWETKFAQLKPVKRSGGRRYYRPEDIELLRRVRQWLYQDGYTIRGVQKLLETGLPGAAEPGADPDTDGSFAAAPADGEPEPAPEPDADPADRAHGPAQPGPDRKPATFGPETRAELEEIRRELLQARALLDDLLRQAKG